MNDASTAALRFALYTDLALVFGTPLFALYALRRRERMQFVPSRWLAALLLPVSGLALSVLGVAMLAASMAGVALTQVDRLSIDAILWETSIGTAALVRMGALMAASLAPLAFRRAPTQGLVVLATAGAVALGSLAWTGHGAMDEGAVGWAHLIADIVHLLSAGAWIGAIAGLGALLFHRNTRDEAAHLRLCHRALNDFPAAGTIIVALLVASGIMNTLIVIGPGNLTALPGSAYGHLLITKLVLFVGMLGIAAANRFRLTPRLDRQLDLGPSGLSGLRRSLVVEAALGTAIFGVVAVLGRMEPS